jgi:chromosome segregation ATPase
MQLEKQYQDAREQAAAQNSQVSRLQQELAAMQEDHQRMAAEAENATKALDDKANECATLVSSTATAQMQARALEEQVTASEASTKALEARLAAAEEAEAATKVQLEDAHAAVRDIEARCKAADEALSQSTKEKSVLEERYSGCVKQLTEAEESLKELEMRYNGTIGDFQEQLLRAAELESEVGALRNAKQELEGQVQAMKDEVDMRSADAAHLQQQLDNETAAGAEGAAAKEDLQLKLSAAEEQLQAVSDKMAALEEQVGALTAQLDDVNGQLATMQADKTVLEKQSEELAVAHKLLQDSDEHKAGLIVDLNAEVCLRHAHSFVCLCGLVWYRGTQDGI